MTSYENYAKTSRKTVFLDRDGTLIIDKIYLNDPDQIEYLPGVFEALCRLRDGGYQFIVVTNQSGIARGIVSVENLNETHRRIRAAFAEHGVEFKEFYYAPYSVESDHPMRKPHPGMLLQGAKDFDVYLPKSWMIGDRLSDVIAGSRAGCRTILLSGVELPDPTAPQEAQPTRIVDSLLAAADQILKSEP
ncbi:MAG: HAD family hydrolase [Deltaproteobacteria bacterium]|jgi:histidinol-phosphate phosphatase family protein|nr:HAD family hydrolase [Deltaproteobacteria bacterium]